MKNFLIIAILAIVGISAIVKMQEITIVRKDVITNFSESRTINKPEVEEDYLIKYGNREFLISSLKFSNGNIASNFFNEFILSYRNISKENVAIKEYSGLALKLNEEEGILLEKGNNVIIAKGRDKDLVKVIEWFIKHY